MKKTLLYLSTMIYCVCCYSQYIPQMELKTPNLEFSTFTPSTYSPQQPDRSILQRSLERQRQRANDAQDALGKLVTLCTEFAEKIPPSEIEWFNTYCENMCSQVDELMTLGYTESAWDLAYKFMSQLRFDKNVTYRIDSYKRYCDDMRSPASYYKNGRVNQTTYEWFCINNQYKFSPKYDSSGNLTGYNPVNVSDLYPSINWDEAYQFITSQGQSKEDVERMWSVYFWDPTRSYSLYQEFEVTKFCYGYLISHLYNTDLSQAEKEQMQLSCESCKNILTGTDNQISYDAFVNNLKNQVIVQPTSVKSQKATSKNIKKKKRRKSKK